MRDRGRKSSPQRPQTMIIGDDYEGLKEYLQRERNVDSINLLDVRGMNLLEITLRLKKQGMSNLLIASGADPYWKNLHGQTSLMLASQRGLAITAEILILSGVALDEGDLWGRSALMYATVNKHLQVVKLLLKYGANPDKRDNKGRTAIFYTLLAAEIQSSGPDQEETPHSLTLEEKSELFSDASLEIIKSYNPQFEDLNRAPKSLNSGLPSDLPTDPNELMMALMGQGASLDHADEKGETLIHYAANKSDQENYDFLLKNGADAHRKNKNKESASEIMMIKGKGKGESDEDEDFLVKSGKRPQRQKEKTHLIKGKGEDHQGKEKNFMVRGKEASHEDEYDQDARLITSKFSHHQEKEIIQNKNRAEASDREMVRSQGQEKEGSSNNKAKGQQEDNKKYEQMKQKANRGGKEEFSPDVIKVNSKFASEDDQNLRDTIKVKTAWSKGIIEENFNFKSKKKKVEGVPVLPRIDVTSQEFSIANITSNDVNKRNDQGQTLLMKACYMGNLSTVKLLIKKGADLNIKDFQGNTSLVYAVKNGQLVVVEYLLGLPQNLESKNSKGHTALSWAVALDRPDMMKKLIEAGANFKLTIKGMDLLMLGAKTGSLQAIKMLLMMGLSPFNKDFKGKNAAAYAQESGLQQLADFFLHAARMKLEGRM